MNKFHRKNNARNATLGFFCHVEYAVSAPKYMSRFLYFQTSDRSIEQAPVTSTTPSAFTFRTGTSHLISHQ